MPLANSNLSLQVFVRICLTTVSGDEIEATDSQGPIPFVSGSPVS